ncbi:dihydrofolate reductase family protein [Lapillicoccus jejuensis]|uniref:RibD domain-containing protein n=1 Tax=Lapillicoccus jejuensis TaxID=402171 RepID=A0A542DWU0_9MICO|nr:dihydrofolate reductase family protein [Lapillicoccus jejuensis]TQJ07394.1 RibD domain-containing protein [Lapillicoccus jejuensis]
MSRTVLAHQFSSLDGVAQSPHLFQFGAFGAEEGAAMETALAGVTDVVIGRVLWEEWKAFWSSADADDPFGAFINPARKHVVSSTLEAGPDGELDWNSTLVGGDPVEYVRALKESDGGGINVVGGVRTVRSLFLGGVVDRLMVTIHPALAGAGERLFDDSVPVTRLRLLEGAVTPAGNALMTYARYEG